jgi:hypothetical protein
MAVPAVAAGAAAVAAAAAGAAVVVGAAVAAAATTRAALAQAVGGACILLQTVRASGCGILYLQGLLLRLPLASWRRRWTVEFADPLGFRSRTQNQQPGIARDEYRNSTEHYEGCESENRLQKKHMISNEISTMHTEEDSIVTLALSTRALAALRSKSSSLEATY